MEKTDATQEKIQIERISDLDVSFLAHTDEERITKRIELEVVPVIVKRRKATPTKWECLHCGTTSETRPTPIVKSPDFCPNTGCGRRDFKITGYSNMLELLVQDAAASDNPEDLNSQRPLKVYYSPKNGEKPVLSGVCRIRGNVETCANRLGGKVTNFDLCFFADSITPSTTYFERYVPDDFALVDFEKLHFANFTELLAQSDKTIAPHIVGRGLAKVATDLWMHTPLYVDGEVATGNLLMLGDSRVGKTEIGQDAVVNLCPTGSEYVIAESASRTGISYAIDTSGSEPELRWGSLVNSDKMAVCLDGLHKWHEGELMQLREALSQRKIKVNRIIRGEAFARTRPYATMNTPKPLDAYPSRWQATSTVLNYVDRNRFDFVFAFGGNDVESDSIEDVENRKGAVGDGGFERAISADVYRNHLCYCWQRHGVEWEDNSRKYFIDQFKTRIRMAKLKGKSQHFLPNDFVKRAKWWLVAVAMRDHSFSAGNVLVQKKHADVMIEFISRWLDSLDVDVELAFLEATTSSSVEELAARVNTSLNRRNVLLQIAKAAPHPIEQREVAKALQLDTGNLSKLVGVLRDWGLVDRRTEGKERGEELTELGAKVARLLVKLEPPKDDEKDGLEAYTT